MELLAFQMMQAISFQNCTNLLSRVNMLYNMVSKYIEMFLVGLCIFIFQSLKNWKIEKLKLKLLDFVFLNN
jgi:predicted transcriptional regulator